MRIVALTPSAAEIVYLLGLGDQLVARSHDCDYPPEVEELPVVSASDIGNYMSSAEIDRAVKDRKHTGRSVFHIDQKKLGELNPDLILTQELCEVCAPTFTQIHEASQALETDDMDILSLDPHGVEDMLENIKTVGQYTNTQEAATQAVAKLRQRLQGVEKRLEDAKPTVVVIEWLEPLMSAGHWVPDMVERAGGQMLLAELGEKSRQVEWDDILEADPEVLVVAPCGFDKDRTSQEMNLLEERAGWQQLQAVQNDSVYLMNGDAYLTRPGPRLVDGMEILASILHS